MRRIPVFAYGSNLSSRRLRRRTPSARPLCVASLRRHVLRFHKRGRDGSAKADAFLTGDAADRIHGVVYEIDAAELPILDRAETGYSADPLDVHAAEGPRSVRVYRALPNWIDGTLQPFRWYVRYVLDGAREHRLPDDWIRRLERVRGVPDPDVRRAAGNA